MDKPPPYSPPGVAPPQPGFAPDQPGIATQPGFSPQPGYPPQSQAPYPVQPHLHYHPPTENTVIIANGPMVITTLGPNSTLVSCPHCHHTITTRVETEPTTKTHLFALLMCLFVCWPCCFLPYCMETCQSKNHYCPHCGAFLGSYDD